MTKFAAITCFLVFSLDIVSHAVKIEDANDVNHDVSDRIFGVIDDLFISLKINQKMIKSKNVEEYTALHNFIQDMVRKNHDECKEIRNEIKSTISNKTADEISGVNEIIDEMIKEQAPQKKSIRDEIKVSYQLKTFDDLKKIAEGNHVETQQLIPHDFIIWGSNSRQKVEGRRIFAGSDTGIGRYPFIVSVHVAGRFVCAGSLLHESLVLSAASCLMRIRDEPDLLVQIRIGSDYVTKNGYLVNIGQLIFHPEFDRTTLANNLVIIKTRKALRFQKRKVVAIKYDKWDASLSVMKNVKDVVILGWGRRGPSETNDTEDRPLSRARLNIYDLEECKYIYSREYVTDKNFCAGFVDRGEGACNHDGGGPALAGSLLAGVISFGSPHCGRVDAPTVFTRLGLYADWIDSVMDGVMIAKGKLANPQTFQIPGSMEIGVRSEEIDNVETEQDSPREVLEREFGIKDVINGPIDRPTNETVKSSMKANEHVDNKNDIFEKNLTEVNEHSDADQIELSEDSEEFTTSAPEDVSTLLPESEKFNNDRHGESDVFKNFVKQLFEGSKSIEANNETDTSSKENDYVDAINALRTTTKASQSESCIEHAATKQRIEVTSIVPITQLFKWASDSSDKSKEKPLELFELQYQIDIKLKADRLDRDNRSVIILSNGGTTQRIKVKDTNKLKNKLTARIKDLIENLR